MGDTTLELLYSLVPLTTRPESEWVGLTVYHPGAGQSGSTPYWRFCDEPEWQRKIRYDPDDGDLPEDEPDWNALIYDVGQVTKYEESEYGRQEHDVSFRVTICMGEPFDNPTDWCLYYAACFLWVEERS